MRIAMAGVVALAGTLAACGSSSDGDDYCRQLKTSVSAFANLDSGNFPDVVRAYHRLAEAAPDEVKADWQTLDTTMTALDKALRAADITLGELPGTPTQTMPAGVDPAKVRDVTAAASKLRSPAFTKAATAVQEHGEKVCGVTTSETS
ncbi:hypothetical protein DX116_05225 [Aeromicrobium endophyticum]|uniref:Lipoprotein n=2 Tax=Aeromicrobium endophyticum TaxID=2292704 RepID=A0A371PAM6_9ACTN|nr:hypothetical protein DX116_05225 [Aeromicrobium endophyticum]